jgi:tRNA 2-selenouridine synthase
MPHVVDIAEFLERSRSTEIIDVRSPGEYERGRIPGAKSLPLFDDDERAKVGISYKHNGQELAILKGLELVGPKMKSLAKSLLKIVRSNQDSANQVLLHCWRGGMRSRSVAWLAEQGGIEVFLLDGGYKAYRHHVQASFKDPLNAVILSGLTGSGKTLILHRLKEMGEQVVDLEGLANHRGSALGGIGLPPQPTVEHFENLLFDEVRQLDPGRPIWLEDESRKIGSATIPNEFLLRMRDSPAIFLDVPRSVRSQIAIDEYGGLPVGQINDSINRITKRMGGQNTKAACEALARGDLEQCVDLLLDYYDKGYLNAKARSPREISIDLQTDQPLSQSNLDALVAASRELVERRMQRLTS